MDATLDPVRRRLYLEAMGIQVWRHRAGAPAGEGDDAPRDAGQAADPLPAAASLSSGAPSANRVSTAPEAPRLPITPNSPFSPTARSGPGAPVPARVDTAAPTVEVSTLGWDELRAAVATCRACGLCATRTQTVFGVGRRDADLMFIGEAPGAEEDRRGEPFVGRAGQLLDRMLAAIGLDRDQVFIANILKCRPPGNRDPKPEEAAACRAFLLRQIALVQPRVLVSLGRISAQNLLESDEAVGRLRGRWLSFGPSALPLMVTYHPSYLLRSPEQKARAWQDLVQVARRLRGA